MLRKDSKARTIRFSGSVMEKLENISEEKYMSVNAIVQQLVDKGLADMQLSEGKFEDFLPDDRYGYSGRTTSFVAVRNMFLLEKLIVGYDENAESILKQASKDAQNLLMWDVENS
jgi:hypothetical protein